MDQFRETKIMAAFSAMEATLKEFLQQDISIICVLLTPMGTGHAIEVISDLTAESAHAVLTEFVVGRDTKLITTETNVHH